ncbi:hypothetical protein G7Y89_g11863 [Cudoniella acicularis]|uniref:Uncharacterized protein n=1 Tax=Cudoniella acicularis TaxID=354080 RepID=A0A8H4RA60_9HELO|nr:hypothetical protein G7Y89_g11863 [Cudoniella acicularis]
MCNYCTHLQRLDGIPAVTLKQIYLLLAKLHRHTYPTTEELWARRYDLTKTLRELLASVYAEAPVPRLKELLEEVEKGMGVLEGKVMPGDGDGGEWRRAERMWRWGWGVGGGEGGEEEIQARDSVSCRIREERERVDAREAGADGRREPEGLTFDEEYTELCATFTAELQTRDKSVGRLEGVESKSDLDPSLQEQEDSLELVLEWMELCNEMVEGELLADSDSESLVSFVGGGLKSRPKLDVEVWATMENFNTTARDSRARRGTLSGNSRVFQHPSANDNDYVYDQANYNFDPDARVARNMVKARSDSSAKQQQPPPSNLIFGLFSKLTSKLSGKKQPLVEDSSKKVRLRRRYKNPNVMMSGGRGQGEEFISPQSRREMPRHYSLEQSRTRGNLEDEGSRSAKHTMDREENVILGLQELKLSKDAPGNLMNSRSSEINLGSLIEQPRLVVLPTDDPFYDHIPRPRRKNSEDSFVPTAPVPIRGHELPRTAATRTILKPSEDIRSPGRDDTATETSELSTTSIVSSRSSPLNLGSLLALPRGGTAAEDRLENQRTQPRHRTPSVDSFVPTAPKPIGRSKPTQATQPRSKPSEATTASSGQGRYETRMGNQYELMGRSYRGEQRRAERRSSASEDPWMQQNALGGREVGSKRRVRAGTGVDIDWRNDREGESDRRRDKRRVSESIVEGNTVSDAVQRRRAERAGRVTYADKYNSLDRQKYWSPGA